MKLGQDLGNQAAHPHQEFRGVHPGGQSNLAVANQRGSSSFAVAI